jgi:hypothetical protein
MKNANLTKEESLPEQGETAIAFAEDDNVYYNLPGCQVEPESGYWNIGRNPLPHVVSFDELIQLTQDTSSPYYVPPYPNDEESLNWEIAELKFLEDNRDNPYAITGEFDTPPPGTYPEIFKNAGTERLGISDFIQIDPPPFGAIFNIDTRPQNKIQNINQQQLHRQQYLNGSRPPLVTTGRELARLFENETPGLIHRHALNYLLYKRPGISPTRQARIWMALDVAIYSALVAAWYFKWAAPPPTYSYRLRPYEYDQNSTFKVLFDTVVNDLGTGDKCPRTGPQPSPGTPRHPAYPSGHSTFSAAASDVLSYFFPEEKEQFDRLANNIGTARLWAGVHWRSDHIAGQLVGRAIAKIITDQLQGDCTSKIADQNTCKTDIPPNYYELAREATNRRTQGICDADHDTLSTQRSTEFDDCGQTLSAF